jgi:regulatory protein
MLITNIKKQKRNKNRYSVYVEGAYSFSVSDETLYKFDLKEDIEISEKELEKILDYEKKHFGMQTAFTLLSYRSRSKKELHDRLKKKDVDDKNIKEISGRLEELGYLNDVNFAKNMASYRKSQGKGREFIKNDLKLKGVDNQTITEVLDNLYTSEAEETDQIKQIAVNKLKLLKNQPAEEVKNKLLGLLSRRGFPIDKIFDVLKDLKKDFNREPAE